MRHRLPLLGLLATLLAGCTVVHPINAHHRTPAVPATPRLTAPPSRPRLADTSTVPERPTPTPSVRPAPAGAPPARHEPRGPVRRPTPPRTDGDTLCHEGVRYGQIPPSMLAACRRALTGG